MLFTLTGVSRPWIARPIAAPMNTVRYAVCGALTGYALLAWISGLGLLGRAGVMVLPAALIGGGYYGYCHARKKQVRNTGVVQVLPEGTQDGTHATAA